MRKGLPLKQEDLHLDENLSYLLFTIIALVEIYTSWKAYYFNHSIGSAIILCSCQPQKISDCFLSQFI